jgi:hypothetical protein
MSSRHFYFGTNNFEQQTKRKISTPSGETGSGICGPNPIGVVSGTTTPKNFLANKLSSSSTSSLASCTFSVLNGNDTNQQQQQQQQYPNLPINPFEETNRFRLEQSVLSPNLFHVANTSTPEVFQRFFIDYFS